MKLTAHALERMRRRKIGVRRLAEALLRGREIRSDGALLILHKDLRVIVCPHGASVLTAWWKRRGRTWAEKIAKTKRRKGLRHERA